MEMLFTFRDIILLIFDGGLLNLIVNWFITYPYEYAKIKNNCEQVSSVCLEMAKYYQYKYY